MPYGLSATTKVNRHHPFLPRKSTLKEPSKPDAAKAEPAPCVQWYSGYHPRATIAPSANFDGAWQTDYFPCFIACARSCCGGGCLCVLQTFCGCPLCLGVFVRCRNSNSYYMNGAHISYININRLVSGWLCCGPFPSSRVDPTTICFLCGGSEAVEPEERYSAEAAERSEPEAPKDERMQRQAG